VKPLARELDQSGRFPSELVKAWPNSPDGRYVPEAFGGAAAARWPIISPSWKSAKPAPSTGVILSAHTSLCTDPILKHGPTRKKKKYSARSRPDKSRSYALTEPSGRDASHLTRTSKIAAAHYELNAQTFVTNGAMRTSS